MYKAMTHGALVGGYLPLVPAGLGVDSHPLVPLWVIALYILVTRVA